MLNHTVGPGSHCVEGKKELTLLNKVFLLVKLSVRNPCPKQLYNELVPSSRWQSNMAAKPQQQEAVAAAHTASSQGVESWIFVDSSLSLFYTK